MLKYVVLTQQQIHTWQWQLFLKAGLDGIKNNLTPPAAVDRNIYVMTKEEREEVVSLIFQQHYMHAFENFKSDEVIKEALRRTFIRTLH